jgi:cobalt/nickel transport system permease protein
VHIPDGYLSPETCGLFYAVMVPLWYRATRRVRDIVKSRYVPLIAMGAAFSFLVMMFNIPVPGGTTAHAVGAVMIAIVLGPWAAVIAVSLALAIQALFFGDGGVLALGANAFNMAFVMPFVGYGVYRLLARRTSLTAPRRAVAAGVGGYVGIVAAALCAAIEFGVQPDLFHTANGTPLYAPFHLAQTIPAMLVAHLTVAGFAEFVCCFGVVAYLQRANVPILRINHADVPVTALELDRRRPLTWKHALAFFGATVALTPIGLLASGGAFGEDAPADLDLARYHLSAAPQGLLKFSTFWNHTVLGGYGFANGEHPVIGYLISAVVGCALITAMLVGAVWLTRAIPRRAARARVPRSRPAPAGRPPHPAKRSTTTPGWLVSNEVGLCPCGCIGTRRRGSFVERTLVGASNVVRQAMFGEDVAARNGLLQRLDARIKILALPVLLLTAAFVRSIPALMLIYAVTLALAAASRLSLRFFVKRVWLFVPIFTGIIAIPAMFSFVTPGTIVVPLWSWHGQTVGLTSQGITSAGILVMRVACSVSIVVLLTLTTSWTKLLAGLRGLFVPKVLILIVGMAYRYVFLLLNAVTDMYTARKARSVGNPNADVRAGGRYVAATAGALFGKAHALSDEVHMAMVSRGYTGDAKTLDAPAVGAADLLFLAGVVAFAVLALGGDRLVGR